MIDKTTIEKAARSIIGAIGENPEREGLKDTPQRIADMYDELFAGIGVDAKAELSIGFEEGHREMVILRNIPFYSMCEHHLLPFYGLAHVGYIPNDEGRVVGISKIARVVNIFARRLQLQERMTTQIADAILSTATGWSCRSNTGRASVYDNEGHRKTGEPCRNISDQRYIS